MSRALSGSRRVLNDTVVNIHSTCQSYKNCVLRGVNVLQRIQAASVKEDSDFEALGKIIKEMGDLVQKLDVYSEQLGNLYELSKMSPATVPFLTWSYKDFSDAGAEVYESYKKETEVKVKIAHSIYGCWSVAEQLNFCLIGWTHLVYVMDETRFQAMLHECGLK